MLAVFILAMFFTTMFIIAFTIQDPLGDDLDDYDVDALLLSTESSLYTYVCLCLAPWSPPLPFASTYIYV